jgi:hypothetical protein
MQATTMSKSDLEKELIDIAREYIEQGPGYSQETVVLREAAQRLGVGDDIKQQQQLLTAWNDLFREGVLAWGYDVDNPSAPFFHLAER